MNPAIAYLYIPLLSSTHTAFSYILSIHTAFIIYTYRFCYIYYLYILLLPSRSSLHTTFIIYTYHFCLIYYLYIPLLPSRSSLYTAFIIYTYRIFIFAYPIS